MSISISFYFEPSFFMRRPLVITATLFVFALTLSGCLGNGGQNIAKAKEIDSERSTPSQDIRKTVRFLKANEDKNLE